jgi:hypothetical protein
MTSPNPKPRRSSPCQLSATAFSVDSQLPSTSVGRSSIPPELYLNFVYWFSDLFHAFRLAGGNGGFKENSFPAL